MAGVGRNLWLTAILFVPLAIASALLPSTLWLCGLAALLALAGVVLLRGNRWRSAALLAAAVAAAVGLPDAAAGRVGPPTPHPGLGQRPHPPRVAAPPAP